jgi:hypothetical protein
MNKNIILTLVALVIGLVIVSYTFNSTLLSVIITANTSENKQSIDDIGKYNSMDNIDKPNTAMNFLRISRDIEVAGITSYYMTLYIMYIIFIYFLSLF